MSDLINQLGGQENLVIIFYLASLMFLLNSFFKRKIIRRVLAGLFSVVLMAQLTSLYFTQSFVGYQFYVHANVRGVLGLHELFINQLFILVFLSIVAWLVFSKANWAFNTLKLKFNGVWLKYFRGFAFLFLLVLFSQKTTFFKDSATLIPLFQTSNKADFTAILTKYGMQNYVTPDKIQSDSKSHNIIIISMESLEKGYLTPKFDSLTPNLNRLKKDWNYVPIKPNLGSEWTSGAMYTCLTGFPALFGAEWNDIFYTTYGSEITSISHVLNKENYKTTYLNGNTDHSGVKSMLNVFDFDQVIDYQSVPSNGFESVYGLRDLDLFRIAKKEVLYSKEKKEKSALFISTTDTHFPNGIYDERMEKVISPKSNNLAFTVNSLDYLIGDLINFLDSLGELENTKIFLFPDHLKMGNPNMFNGTGERALYCISNSNISEFEKQSLYQIDIPKVILKGSEINHNLKFFTDYIHEDKAAYIENHQPQITEINTTGNYNSKVKRFTVADESEFYEEYKNDTSRFIAHAGGILDGLTYTNCREALDNSYAKGFRLFELDLIKTSDDFIVAAHDWVSWANNSGYKGELPVSKEEFLSYKIFRKYAPMDMDSINEWFLKHPDAILVTDKINEPSLLADRFVDKERLMMEVFTNEAVKDGLQVGIKSVMPSHDLVVNYSKKELKELAEAGVNAVAISRRYINENKEQLMFLKELGIKAYAFHLNMEMNINENFVVKHEMDYIHGIYADKWEFKP